MVLKQQLGDPHVSLSPLKSLRCARPDLIVLEYSNDKMIIKICHCKMIKAADTVACPQNEAATISEKSQSIPLNVN